MIEKEYDVFIAYHGSYEKDSARGIAEEVYNYLKEKGLKCFFFPKMNKDTYKANIIDVMRSRKFILICNENLHIKESGQIDTAFHYELSTEIDAFYALTQLGNDVKVIDSKVLVCGDYINKRKKGDECKLHSLFDNRTHFYYDENNKDEVFKIIYDWVKTNVIQEKNNSGYKGRVVSNEVKQVFGQRSSLSNVCDLNEMVANAKNVYAIGISNTELTYKIDPEAVKYAIENGANIECIFLDPDGKNTKIRELEENVEENRIKNTTVRNISCAKDIKKSLNDERKNNFKMYIYDLTPRMNILIIDNKVILQYYANFVPGLKNPCFLIERQDNSPLYDFCLNSFKALKQSSKEIV